MRTAVSDGQHTGEEDETRRMGLGEFTTKGKTYVRMCAQNIFHSSFVTACAHLALLVVFVGSDDSTR